MPSNNWRRGAGSLPLPVLLAPGADVPRADEHLISPFSYCALGEDAVGLVFPVIASNTYPAASRALAYPFELAYPFLVRKVWWFNGVTATTDSADVAVYTEGGTRLVSGGGTAISGASGLQEVDVTDTLLRPGRYWAAYAQNGVTATPMMTNASASNMRAAGCAQMAAAYVLPSTFTPAAVANSNLPIFGIASRTLAA